MRGGGFSGGARGGFGNMTYGNNYQNVNTNEYTNANKNVSSGTNIVGSSIPSEWHANVPSGEVTDTIRIRITELIRPVTEEDMRKVFDRVGVQVRQLCVEPTSSTTEASVLVQFTDPSVSQHAMTLLNNRFIYNNAHKMTMSYAHWTGGMTNNSNSSIFAQSSNYNINKNNNISANNNNAVLPTPPQAPVMLPPPSPSQMMMTNKSAITPGPATLSSVFNANTLPINKNNNTTTNSTTNNSMNNFTQSNANNLTLTPHITPMSAPFTSMSNSLPHQLPLQSQLTSATSQVSQQVPLVNNMPSQVSQGMFNPALPLPLAPQLSSNPSQMPMSHVNTLKNINVTSSNNNNANSSFINSNAIMPISELSGVVPTTSASIMPLPTQTNFSTTPNNNTNITNTSDPFGNIFNQDNNRQGSGALRGRGRGRGRGRRDMTYVNRSTSGLEPSFSYPFNVNSSSTALLPSTLSNASINPSMTNTGFNPMVPMTQPSMIPVPFVNSLLQQPPGPGIMGPMMMPNMTTPHINEKDMPTVFLSLTTMPVTEPLQSLFLLIEAYGGVVSIRRNNEKRHIVTVKMSSIEEANNVLQYFHRIPFANETISAKRFPTYHERHPCTDDGDPLNPETIQYDFTASRHRSPMQRSRSYPTCMVKITGCGNYVEADVMMYLNSKSFYPQRIHKEDDGSFTVQLDDAETSVKMLIACQNNICNEEKSNVIFISAPKEFQQQQQQYTNM